jgi:uncharacterized Fe-S radical SAM superfamily protein PflX
VEPRPNDSFRYPRILPFHPPASPVNQCPIYSRTRSIAWNNIVPLMSHYYEAYTLHKVRAFKRPLHREEVEKVINFLAYHHHLSHTFIIL